MDNLFVMTPESFDKLNFSKSQNLTNSEKYAMASIGAGVTIATDIVAGMIITKILNKNVNLNKMNLAVTGSIAGASFAYGLSQKDQRANYLGIGSIVGGVFATIPCAVLQKAKEEDKFRF